jgi:hypothetical protein
MICHSLARSANTQTPPGFLSHHVGLHCESWDMASYVRSVVGFGGNHFICSYQVALV